MLEVPWALGYLRVPLRGTWCRWDECDWRVGLVSRDWRQRAELWELMVEGTLVTRIWRSRCWQAKVWCGAVRVAAGGGGVAAAAAFALRPVLQEGGRVRVGVAVVVVVVVMMVVVVVVRMQEGI